jgi:hypothetical protein
MRAAMVDAEHTGCAPEAQLKPEPQGLRQPANTI